MAKAAIRGGLVVVGLCAALGSPASEVAGIRHYYDCRVTGTEHLPRFSSAGQARELSQFTCRITGGLLDGFTATGTNILERATGGGRLVGSLVVAQKGRSTVLYEVSEGIRRPTRKQDEPGWEGTGSGVYRFATGSAAPLAGRSFSAVARSRGPGVFTIEVVVASTADSSNAD